MRRKHGSTCFHGRQQVEGDSATNQNSRRKANHEITADNLHPTYQFCDCTRSLAIVHSASTVGRKRTTTTPHKTHLSFSSRDGDTNADRSDVSGKKEASRFRAGLFTHNTAKPNPLAHRANCPTIALVNQYVVAGQRRYLSVTERLTCSGEDRKPCTHGHRWGDRTLFLRSPAGQQHCSIPQIAEKNQPPVPGWQTIVRSSRRAHRGRRRSLTMPASINALTRSSTGGAQPSSPNLALQRRNGSTVANLRATTSTSSVITVRIIFPVETNGSQVQVARPEMHSADPAHCWVNASQPQHSPLTVPSTGLFKHQRKDYTAHHPLHRTICSPPKPDSHPAPRKYLGRNRITTSTPPSQPSANSKTESYSAPKKQVT
jgi:hypothetical protein